jgi:hypothetical protein
VADPGSLDYGGPFGGYSKSTPAHSTINVDGMNQSWCDAKLHSADWTPEIAVIHGSYDGGYWKEAAAWGAPKSGCIYARHDRVLVQLRGEYLLVLDTICDLCAGKEIRNCFQMGPTKSWHMDKAGSTWYSENPDINLLIKPVCFQCSHDPIRRDLAGITMQCFEGRPDPIRGWLWAPGFNHIPAPLLEMTLPVEGNGGKDIISAVLLAPFKGTKPPAFKTEINYLHANIAFEMQIRKENQYTDIIAWTTRMFGPLEYGPYYGMYLAAVTCVIMERS